MINRIAILSVLLLLSAAYVATASKTEEVPPRESLASFPATIGEWQGRVEPDFTKDILDVLGVDDYLLRSYVTKDAYAGLYIGYYRSQRQGDTIHSPLNCLPGAGWEPVSKSYLPIGVTSDKGQEEILVNRYVIRKGLDEQVVLYWYQSHGRVVANEYRSKVFMIYDAVRLNRTDAALVRVVSPQLSSEAGAQERAGNRAVEFVKAIYPFLGRYLPA